jgi:hypothetical protein
MGFRAAAIGVLMMIGGCGGLTGGSGSSTSRSDGWIGPGDPAAGDPTCGSEALAVEAVSPNLLIVLDRSCSMRVKAGSQSKWEIAVLALGKLVAKHQAVIRFGLTMFPDTTGAACKQDAIPIPPTAATGAKIQTLLTAALGPTDPSHPNGPCVTNIDTGMLQASAEPALADPGRPRFVLLISDGGQAFCAEAGGDPGTTKIITDLRAKGVATFVVGFGSAVDGKQLNLFADAGGKPSGDPTTRYYKAEDAASLDLALAKIGEQTLGCTLHLKKVPANLDSLHVFFDKQAVARDPAHKDGWDYDAGKNQLSFYGKACSELEGNQVTSVDIAYGCKEPPKEPSCAAGAARCSGKDECPAKQTCLAGCCIHVIE